MKKFKSKVALLLVFFMFGLIVPEFSVSAVTDVRELLINDADIEGETNKFTYHGSGWQSGGTSASITGDEHYNVINEGAADAATKYYTIEFIGNKIEVYGHLSPYHGIMSYSIDGGEAVEVDSYSANRVGDRLLFEADGLEEGPHVLTVVATGKKNASAHQASMQVDYAKVYHEKYDVEDLAINSSDISIMEGATVEVDYGVVPSYATIDDLTFRSENNEVATVTEEGVIEAVSEGTTKIVLASEEYAITKELNVTVEPSVAGMHASIVDTNTHYTDEKHNDILNMGQLSEDLFAWKADKTISEIAIISKDSSLDNVTVTATDFISGDNVLSSDNVTTTFLKDTLAYIGHPGYHTGNTTQPEGPREEAPEILYTSEPVDIGFNKVQPVWVEFDIPEDTAPGIYTGTVTVTADEIDTPLIFTYNVEVLDVAMPSVDEYLFDFEAWQYPYSTAEYYDVEPFSPEHFEILTPHMLEYKEIGGYAITTTIVEEAWGGQTYSANEVRYPSMIKWTKSTTGEYLFDFTDFDKWVQFNKDLGIGDKIIAYSMIPWNNRITYYNESTQEMEYITVSPGTTAYEEVWTKFLTNFIAHLDEKGWFDDTYIGIDERGNFNLAFDVIDKVLNEDGKALKKSTAADHFSQSYFTSTTRMDFISVGQSVKTDLDLYKEYVEERNNSEMDYDTTIYTCTGHFPNSFSLSMPGESYWTMMFAASFGSTGYMRWAYDAWVEDPLREVSHWAFEAGDTFLVFPDEKDVENPMPKTSVRFEKMAEGIRDVNKLYYMAERIPELQEDIDELLATVRTDYTGDTNSGGARYASEATRESLPTDMENIRDGIKDISEKYIELMETRVEDVTDIEVNVSELELELGVSTTLNATVLPNNTANLGVEWVSSNEEVVTVAKTGKIETVGIGEATITVRSTYNEEVFTEVSVRVIEKNLDEYEVAYYDFEDIDGNEVEDKWNSYDGVLEGAEVIDGVVGKALQFNEGTDNVTINNPTSIETDWTLSMWVKKGDIENYPASIMWDGNDFTSGNLGSESIDIEKDDTRELGVHVKKGILSYTESVQEDKWVHLAWVNDSKVGLTVYVDGESIGTKDWAINNEFNAPLKVIGGRNYIGAIDEVKVYNTALDIEQIAELGKLPGLNVDSSYKQVMIDETVKIETELVGDYNDLTITFESRNPDIATVDPNGVVTGVAYGSTEIVIHHSESDSTKVINILVDKELNIGYSIPQYEIPVEEQIVIDREPGQYLGHPDMIALDDNHLITVYPEGHGVGPIIMKESYDGGITWSDRLETNDTWDDSKETPTIYTLEMQDGTRKLIEISGRPQISNRGTGWNTSISEDDGETWSDFKLWYEGQPTIVAMASLVHLKDKDGNYIDKWMGVYHNGAFENFKTYLTFDEDGNEQWSEPEAYLAEYREIESKYMICEVGMFRSPDGERIVALGRSQSHMNLSTMFYSDDEGETWSVPREIQGSLLGERHKAVYDPISGRLVITFREIILDYNQDGNITSGDWMAGDWVAWVGTYEQLMNGEEGEYRILLAEDYTPSAKSGDTGYAGIVALSDGTFVLNSYGCFDEEDPVNNPNGSAYKPYIIGVRFKLAEIDAALGLIDKSELEKRISEVENLDSAFYSEESFEIFEVALEAAKEVLRSDEYQQIQIDEILAKLNEAVEALEEVSVVIKDADLNDDGVVNILDLALASKNYGKNSKDNVDEWDTLSRYDLNNDNVIDDYEINYIMDEILGR